MNNESKVYLFPYEKINKNDRILIYGGGIVGQSFCQQIRINKYCKIVAIIDKDYDKYPCALENIISIYEIDKFDYDKILIAVNSNYICNDIKEELVYKYNIDSAKIVLGADCKILFKFEGKTNLNNISNIDCSYKYTDFAISFYITGGLGDCIVIKRFIKAILDLNDEKSLKVDIFCENNNFNYVESIFRGMVYVENIFIGRNFYYKECHNYAFSLTVNYILHFTAVFFEKIKSTKMSIAIEKLYKEVINYKLNIKKATDNAIHFERCRIKKQNCYTAYEYGIFDLSDYKVDIPIEESIEKEWKRCNFTNYITINYGWGNNPNGKSKIPNKIWPKSYYQKLVGLIKDEYPKIKILQIGVEDENRFNGIDYFIAGKSLDFIKTILKNSFLHIDCEGGIVHLATQLDTKCIVMFGPTPVHYFSYENNVNIVSKGCNNCYYLQDDFSKCLFEINEPHCMYSIKPESVLREIKKIIL